MIASALRVFVFLIALLPTLAASQNFDPASTQKIQQALNRLGYPAGEADGQWGKQTGLAVRQYRFEFALEDRASLSLDEANELINRSLWLDEPPRLLFGTGTDTYQITAEVARDRAAYRPETLLYASERHLLAMQLLTRVSTGRPSDVTYDQARDWTAAKRQRARGWLSDDLARLAGRQDDPGLLSAALLQIDMTLTFSGLRATREDILRDVMPKLKLIHDRFEPARQQADFARQVTERLMHDLGRSLEGLSCNRGPRLDRASSDLALEIMRRFESIAPASPHLYGYGLQLANCADDATAKTLLDWRIEDAMAQNDVGFAVAATQQAAAELFDRGDMAGARGFYYPLLNGSPKEIRDQVIRDHMHRLIDLGEKDFVGAYLLEQVDAMRGTVVQSTAAMGNARYVATNLLQLGFGFNVVDRIYFETDNMWKEDGDIFLFYSTMIRSLINDGDAQAALAPVSALIMRAEAEGNPEAAESFREQEMAILLGQGRYSEAEDRIADFIAAARQGARDPRVAAWQTRLNLSRGEGGAPGRVYAEQFAAYLDAVCAPDAPREAHEQMPALDRDSVYADPEFMVTARKIGLPAKIAQCQGAEWLQNRLARLGCYLWAKEGDLGMVQVGMQQWHLQQTLTINNDGSRFDGFDGMDCPMGVAEAGRHDLVVQYGSQIPPGAGTIGLQLLRLSAGLPIDAVTANMLDASRERETLPEASFPLLEVAGRANHITRAARRDAMFYQYGFNSSGAAMDNAEWVAIRTQAVDLAKGYAALNLTEIALMFSEGAAVDLGTSLSPEQAATVLDDGAMSQVAILRGQIALKMGDTTTALKVSGPVISTYVARVRAGQAGSVEELAAWAQRLAGFAELYLSALAADPALLAAEPVEAVLDAQQLLAAASASSSSGRLAARLASADPVLARAYQDAVMDFRGAMAAASRDGDGARVAMMRDKVRTLKEDLARLDPAFGANSTLSVPSLVQIRASLKDGTALVLTSLPQHLIQTRIDAGTVAVHVDAFPRDRLAETIRTFRATIQNEEDVANAAGTLLSQTILSRLGSQGLPKRLVLVVDGPLVTLPFGALPLIIGGQQSYLGVHSGLSLLPSLTLLTASGASDKASVGSRVFLGVGDARYSPDAAKRTLGFVPSDLRETHTELRFMALMLQADEERDLLTGSKASESRIVELSENGELAEYRVLAFATHGFVGQQGLLSEPGLLLSEPSADEADVDGVLSASEIYNLKLDADLVILSACDTGAVVGAARGLSDLSQAFTFAGARSMIVTHWEIDTFAAVELTRRIAAEMRNTPDATAPIVLQTVVKSMLQSEGAGKFHHPKFWASHTVIGL